jgi:hypothetical protein
MGAVKQIGRKSLTSSASLLGLAAGAVGWSGLAQAASEETNSQMMLLPEHYELLENGVVVFKLETGENLSLTADQYLILEDGLLLITDELAQASIYSLPVMGSVRAQLLTDLEQVATIDGTVAQATPAQTLSITEGQAPRLSEQVDLQSYEVAQSSSDNTKTNAAGDALATSMAVAPGAMALLGMLMTKDQPAQPELVTFDAVVFHGTENLGNSLSSAGDIDGDGYDDIIIGERYFEDTNPQGNSNENVGAAWIIWGGPNIAAMDQTGVDLDFNSPSSSRFLIEGVGDSDNGTTERWERQYLSHDVSPAGDFDRDGMDDILVTAKWGNKDPDPEQGGEVYLLWGSAINRADSGNYLGLDGAWSPTSGIVIQGEEPDTAYDTHLSFGHQAIAIDDIDGDGKSEIVVTDYAWSPRGFDNAEAVGDHSENWEGAVYVIWSSTIEAERNDDGFLKITDALLNGTSAVRLEGDAPEGVLGFRINEIDDLDGDGLNELMMSEDAIAWGGGGNDGVTKIVWGSSLLDFKTGDGKEVMNDAFFDGAKGVSIKGYSGNEDYTGWRLADVGDIDGDGKSDVIVSSRYHDSNRGELYLIWGETIAAEKLGDGEIQLSDSYIDGANGVRISGLTAGEKFGFDIAALGDLNGGGTPDLLVTSSDHSNGSGSKGQAYVFWGEQLAAEKTGDGVLELTENEFIDGGYGVVITVEELSGKFGQVAANVGDVDNDGLSDIAVSARWSDGLGLIDDNIESGDGNVALISGEMIVDAANGIGVTTPGVINIVDDFNWA